MVQLIRLMRNNVTVMVICAAPSPRDALTHWRSSGYRHSLKRFLEFGHAAGQMLTESPPANEWRLCEYRSTGPLAQQTVCSMRAFRPESEEQVVPLGTSSNSTKRGEAGRADWLWCPAAFIKLKCCKGSIIYHRAYSSKTSAS